MCVWPESEHCYLICFVHSLHSQSPISDSFLLNPLNLEQKELHFRTRAEWQVSSKPQVLAMAILMETQSSIIRRLSVPVASASTNLSFLHCPSCEPQTLPASSDHTCYSLCLQGLSLSFLHGLIQISTLPLNLELSGAHHSGSHIPCSIFPHRT